MLIEVILALMMMVMLVIMVMMAVVMVFMMMMGRRSRSVNAGQTQITHNSVCCLLSFLH